MLSKKDSAEKVTQEVTTNPLYDDFPTVDVGGFEEEQEEARMKPLPRARYLFEIVGYACFLTREGSKSGAGIPYVRFKCKTIDPEAELDGRSVQTGPLMLRGPGFGFFVGSGNLNRLGFVEIIKPNRKWDVKEGIRLLEKNHKGQEAGSDYLDSFVGCKFSAEVSIDIDKETNEQTGFNSMDSKTLSSP